MQNLQPRQKLQKEVQEHVKLETLCLPLELILSWDRKSVLQRPWEFYGHEF